MDVLHTLSEIRSKAAELRESFGNEIDRATLRPDYRPAIGSNSTWSPGKRLRRTPEHTRKREARQAPKSLAGLQLPLLGSNQDSPDPQAVRRGARTGYFAELRAPDEHRCPGRQTKMSGKVGRNYDTSSPTP